MNDTDQDIIEQVRAGNARQYALLVDRHKDKAMTLALRLVGARLDAEELVQDAFLRAFQNLDRFRGDAKFGTWFYRILYNLCMTRVTRRRGGHTAVDLNEDQTLENLSVDDEEPSIYERLDTETMHQILSEEISRLPERFRSVVTLFYVQEMAYEEIASVLGSPMGSVKTHLFRARELLRRNVLSRMKGEIKAA